MIQNSKRDNTTKKSRIQLLKERQKYNSIKRGNNTTPIRGGKDTTPKGRQKYNSSIKKERQKYNSSKKNERQGYNPKGGGNTTHP